MARWQQERRAARNADAGDAPLSGDSAAVKARRAGLAARWATLSQADRAVALLWLALALALVGIAAGAALRSGSHPTSRPVPGVRVAPAAIKRAPGSFATATGVFPAVDPAAATPAPARAAAAVPDDAIVPAGATLIRRVNLPGANGGPGTIIAYWQSAGPGGCAQPHIAVFRTDSNGRWAGIWDTSASQNGEPPLSPATGGPAGCTPAIGLFAVQPLDTTGLPFLIFSAAAADGSQRVLVESLDDPANAEPAVVQIEPGAQISLDDGPPAVLEISRPVYAPDTAGFAELQNQPIGREDDLRRWQNGAFQFSSREFSPNCLTGKTIGLRTSAAGLLIAFRCPAGGAGGAYAAVMVTGATQIAPNLLIGGLQANDDVTVAVIAPALDADPNALPVAAQVASLAAAARQAAPPPLN